MKSTDGTYRVTRLMRLDGTVLVGEGKTKEEARTRLKDETKKYREALRVGLHLQPTGDTVRSPGLVPVHSNGTVVLSFNHHREVPVLARPDVAAYIKGGRKANYVK